MLKSATPKKARLRKVLIWAGCVLAVILALPLVFLVIVRGITYLQNHIPGDQGVDEGAYVSLGGQEQYLLIRGQDTTNPVIIWLHGGPSSPDAFVNYTFQKYLLSDYTIVNWDQRGCGRTYFHNRKTDPDNQTVSFDQALADLDDLVSYVCQRFETEQVILVGHSYGTMLGSRYTLDHPERISAYIGVGQVVSIESDIYSYRDALATAQVKRDDTSAMEEAYARYLEEKSLASMMDLRKAVNPYHIPEKQANTLWLGVASPYMGISDLRWFLKQAGDFSQYLSLNQPLFDYIMTADVRDYGAEYAVPVAFLTGSCDWTTPAAYAQDYFDWIQAPEKQIHLLDGCGHAPQYDAPEEFCSLLKEILNTYLAE